MTNQHLGDRAVVIGASIAGLLTARVLSDHYGEVVLLDRDEFGTYGQYRKGVPQAKHAHGLLAGGLIAMEELLPGLTDALVARGAVAADMQERCVWVNEGCELSRGRVGLTGVLTSRLLLEDEVRARVTALPNVVVRSRCEAVGISVGGDGRVRGVRVADRDGDDVTELVTADLVVDASGRGSRTPAWLQTLGYGTPPIDEIVVGLNYTTREFVRDVADHDVTGALVVGSTAACPRGGVVLAQPDGRWVVTIGGYLGDAAPADLDGFRAFAGELPTSHVADALEGLEPAGDARTFKFHASAWRRYDRMRRFPEGLLVVGDAVCSFNPIFGQGMSVAAKEAVLLRDQLAKHGTRGLARRFFRGATRAIAAPWDIAASSDLRFPAVEGRRTARVRLVNRYLPRYFRAASHDDELTRRFLLVLNLLAPPQSLLAPAAVLRVLRGGRRRPVAPAHDAATRDTPAVMTT